MRILFYVEPLIEMGRPFWKDTWASYFSKLIIDTLKSSQLSDDVQFIIALNEPLSTRIKLDDDVKLVLFTQSELLCDFEWSYERASLAWYKHEYSASQIDHYAGLIRDKLNGFLPDIIITFSPAPFFRQAYPKSLLLHMEYSIFSRAPYPKSWYLDPTGMLKYSYINTFSNDINNTFLDDKEHSLLTDFKNYCRELVREKSPFKEIIAYEKSRFEYLVLLPLQFSNYYGFDGNTTLRSQFEYLTYVIENVPPNIGLVVTTHPEYPILDSDNLCYFRSKYKNFIYYETFEEYYASSQYLVEAVDAIITVSSSVGLQALLFDKKLFTIGDCFDPLLYDSNDLTTLGVDIKRERLCRDNILFWILTRYAIISPYFSDPEWLANFLINSLSKFKTTGINADFYKPIDDPETVFSKLKAAFDENIPKPSTYKSAHVQIQERDASIAAANQQLSKCIESLNLLQRKAAEEASELSSALQQQQAVAEKYYSEACKMETYIQEQTTQLENKSKEILALENIISQDKLEFSSRISNLEHQLQNILQSKSWVITSPLRKIARLTRR